MLPKDYVRLRLTGEWAIDAADASGTLLFDVAGRRWSDDVLAALEIPAEWLPPVSESTEIAGAGDQQAAALGVGVIEPGKVSVVLGTSGVVLAALPEYAHDPQARVHVFCHALPGTWEAMGVMLNAAGSLRWFRDAFAPDASFDELTAEAARWDAGAEGVTLPPVPPGRAHASRRPGRDEARSRASPSGTTAALSYERCSKASPTACATRSSSSASSASTRRPAAPPAEARTAASGSRSSPPSSSSRSSAASSTRGRRTAPRFSRASPAGTFASAQEAVASCVRARETVEPNPAWARRYDDGYARFRALYPAIRGAEEQDMRLGIVSTADINRKVIPGAHASEKVELVAVASRDQARAEEYAKTWEIERAYGSYEALLEDPDVDAVYISLPNTMHREWSIRSRRSGQARHLREAVQPSAPRTSRPRSTPPSAPAAS